MPLERSTKRLTVLFSISDLQVPLVVERWAVGVVAGLAVALAAAVAAVLELVAVVVRALLYVRARMSAVVGGVVI